ncbi:hypothetical protein N7461_006376 [Penicillium sp. DV-2018c]|nr:hypothetical protein N7461_006376 [Penicillium sp. DV-2018c]
MSSALGNFDPSRSTTSESQQTPRDLVEIVSPESTVLRLWRRALIWDFHHIQSRWPTSNGELPSHGTPQAVCKNILISVRFNIDNYQRSELS